MLYIYRTSSTEFLDEKLVNKEITARKTEQQLLGLLRPNTFGSSLFFNWWVGGLGGWGVYGWGVP